MSGLSQRLSESVSSAGRSVTGVMGGGLFLIFFASQLGQNAALSIVLQSKDFGPSSLPRLYIFNALALGICAYGASRLMTQLSVRRVLFWLFGAGAVLVVIIRYAYVNEIRWAPGALYLVAFGLGDLLNTFFWALAQQIYDTRDAKRSFPLVSAAGTLGAALSGFLAREMVTHVSAIWLLNLWAAMLLGGMLWTSGAARRARDLAFSQKKTSTMGVTNIMRRDSMPLAGAVPAPANPSGPLQSLKAAEDAQPENNANFNSLLMTVPKVGTETSPTDKKLAWTIGVGLIFVVAVTLSGRYLYGRALSETYPNDLEKIAAMNGLLIGLSNLLTLAVQIIVTSFLLQRFGIAVAGAVYPAMMIGVFSYMVVDFGLPAAIVCYFGITTLRLGIQGVVETMLYTPLPPELSARMTVLTMGLGMPMGMAIAGLGLEVLKDGPASSAAMAGGVVALLLLFMTLRRERAYTDCLRGRLLKGGSDVRVRFAELLEQGNADINSILTEKIDPDSPDLLDNLKTLARARLRENRPGTGGGTALFKERGTVRTLRKGSMLDRLIRGRLLECYRIQLAQKALPPLEKNRGARDLWVSALKHRLSENLAVILAALKAETLHHDYDRVSLRVFDSDARIRAAAVEILEPLLPPDLRGMILPLLEEARLERGMAAAKAEFGADKFEGDPIKSLLEVRDDWVRACTFYALAFHDPKPYEDVFQKYTFSKDRFLSFSSEFAIKSIPGVVVT